MKKIFILLMLFILAMPMNGEAKIDKSTSKDHIQLTSGYSIILDKKDDKEYVFYVHFSRNITNFGWPVRSQYYNLGLSAFDYNIGFDKTIVFSHKNTPKFEFLKNNSVKIIVIPKKKTFLSTSQISYSKINSFADEIKDAEKITIIMPMSDGSTKRIELPEEIVAEWNYIMNANMHDEKKEMMDS